MTEQVGTTDNQMIVALIPHHTMNDSEFIPCEITDCSREEDYVVLRALNGEPFLNHAHSGPLYTNTILRTFDQVMSCRHFLADRNTGKAIKALHRTGRAA